MVGKQLLKIMLQHGGAGANDAKHITVMQQPGVMPCPMLRTTIVNYQRTENAVTIGVTTIQRR